MITEHPTRPRGPSKWWPQGSPLSPLRDDAASPGGEGADPKPHSFPPTSLCDMCLTEPYVTHHRGMRYCSKCLHVLANRPAIAARELGLTAADDTIRVECLKCGALIRSNPSDEVDRHSARCWR